jgi:hypothetical protein
MREKRKARKLEAVRSRKELSKSKELLEREEMMRKHLEDNGWVLCEHGSWKICMYSQYNEVYRTLSKAYKMQLKIDANKAHVLNERDVT